MRKKISSIVEDVNEALRLSDGECITIPWQDFYRLSGRERIKTAFLEEIKEQAAGRFQLIISYGKNVVVICHDRNFAPPDSLIQDSSRS